MKTVATLAALAAMANAHATFQQLWKNGKDLESTCARLPSTNSPVEDYTGTALQCNVSPSPAKGKCAFAAGDEVTIEMHQQQNDRSCENQAIGGAHWGPVLAYMSKVEDSSSADGSSEFFKVYENTWAKNPKASQGDEDFWGTKDLNYNCGKLSFKIPEGLAAGDYLLRAEAIALHAASSSGGAQHYMTCYQLTVTGSGTLEPKGVKFPEAYSKTGPGLGFSIHTNMDSYPAPGPKLIAGGTEAKPQLLTFGKIADVPAATGAPAADETPASTAASVVASSTPAASSAVVEAKPSSAAPSAAPVEPTSTPVESETVPTSTPVAEVPFPAGNSTSTMAGTVSSVPVIAPTTMMTSVRPITTAEPSGPIKEYYQCGGMNYKGSSQCAEGLECKQWNPWYSQCVKPGANQPGPSKGPQPPAPKPTAAPAQPAQPAKPVSSYEAEAPKPTAEPSSVIPEAAKPTKPATTPSTPSTPSEGAGEKKYTLETFIAFLEQEAGSASAAKIRRMIEALL